MYPLRVPYVYSTHSAEPIAILETETEANKDNLLIESNKGDVFITKSYFTVLAHPFDNPGEFQIVVDTYEDITNELMYEYDFEHSIYIVFELTRTIKCACRRTRQVTNFKVLL